MKTIKIYPNNPNLRDVEEVAKALRNGDVVIYPTDTLYAIGCDALNVRAVERICKIKGINPSKANFSIICSDLSQTSTYVQISNTMHKILRRNLPGAFTFVLPTTSSLPKIYKERKSVGIRLTQNPIIQTIVETFGAPILTTSVTSNYIEEEYITDPELIAENYESLVDLLVDGGMGSAEPSTVVDCTQDTLTILRQGAGELLE